VFVGIQATGKSSFFRERFFRTHVRINLDMLRTRHREELFMRSCLDGGIPFVVDNTNPTALERARYVAPARSAGSRVVGFYFESRIAAALERNASRALEERIPERGILGTSARLELPARSEGFDALHYVRINPAGGFVVDDWRDEV